MVSLLANEGVVTMCDEDINNYYNVLSSGGARVRCSHFPLGCCPTALSLVTKLLLKRLGSEDSEEKAVVVVDGCTRGDSPAGEHRRQRHCAVQHKHHHCYSSNTSVSK
ncbi:hypothetical protein GW17_00052962 [Ensete ventricosum]|nr:hypothetical protein GW17_00052962 [Ensete ventricosum]